MSIEKNNPTLFKGKLSGRGVVVNINSKPFPDKRRTYHAKTNHSSQK
jgi:hypothetical protein